MHSMHSRARAGAVALALAVGMPHAARAQVVLGIGTPPDNVARPSFTLAVGASGNVSARAVSGLPQQSIMTTPLTWSSSDSSVASLMMINPTTYMVTGKKDGVAIIGYTSQFGSASVSVTVGAGTPAPVTGTVIQPRLTTTMVAPTTTTTATRVPATTTTTTTVTTTTLSATPRLGTATGVRQVTGATVPSAPARSAPAGFTAQYVGAGKAVFAWRSVPGAVGYLVTDMERHTQMPFRAGPPRAIATDTAMVVMLRAGTNTYHVAPVYLKPGETAIAADENNVELTELYSNAQALTVPRWSGKYRVTLNGFRVVQETIDNPLQIDGKRDEVYFRSAAQEFDSLGNAVGSPRDVKSRTYGDVNHDDWKNPALPTYRIKAGSASALGGLMTGDAYPAGATPWVNGGTAGDRELPLLLWEGWLMEDDNAVEIATAVWEDDAKPDQFAPERELVQDLGKYASRRFDVQVNLASAAALPTIILARKRQAVSKAIVAVAKLEENMKAGLGELGITGTPQYSVGMALATSAANAATSFASRMEQKLALDLNLKDRPIGMVPRGSGYDFAPALLNLSYENVEGIVNGGGLTGKGPGVIEVPYADLTSNKGNYVLYIQVQRIQ